MSFTISNLTYSPAPYIVGENISFTWVYSSSDTNTTSGIKNIISIYALSLGDFQQLSAPIIFLGTGLTASEQRFSTTINTTITPGKWQFNVEKGINTDPAMVNQSHLTSGPAIDIGPGEDSADGTMSTNLVMQQTATPISASQTITNTPTQPLQLSAGSSNNAGVIAGSIVGAVAFIVILIALLVFWRYRRSRHADNSAKEMTDMSFAGGRSSYHNTGGRSSYHNVPADASNDLLLRTHDPDLREKYIDTAPHSPESPVPINPPKPYTPQLRGPAESIPATVVTARNQPSSQLYYVPAIAGPGAATTVAPASHDPYGDSKTQEDE